MADAPILKPTHGNFNDIEGLRFGRLVAVRPVEKRRTEWRWLFRCDCGTEKVLNASDVRRGQTTSCGCYRREVKLAEAEARITHGESGKRETAEYRTWRTIKNRCHNPEYTHYKYYGGRGITVCEEWRDSYEAFLAEVGRRPSPIHTIDRIKNERGYEPGNVRWATMEEQGNNRRSNNLLTYRGRTMTVANWARELGIDRATLRTRLRAGWSVEKTLTLPAVKTGRPRGS